MTQLSTMFTPDQLLVAVGVAVFLLLVAISRGAAHKTALKRAETALRQTEAERGQLATEAARRDTLLEARDAALEQARTERTELRSRVGDLQEAAMREGAERAAIASTLREVQDIRTRLDEQLSDMTDRASEAEIALSRLRSEREAADEKIALLSAVRKEMEDKFQQIADASLRQNAEALQISSKERLDAALAPLKQHVDHFQLELRNVHEGALRDRQAMKVEIEALTKRSEEVSREAVNLTRALKGDKQRQGAWGEMILESLLERSGLRKGEEYLVQEHRVSEDGGRYRPDVVVNMPDGKRLVIDSKVSLVDYETCINAEDELTAGAARSRHVAAMKRHIQTLHDKAYHTMEDGSVDYVVMFIPIEGALSEALREMGDLTTMAFDKNVTLATPTTLMMALRTISNVWTIERRNRNAEDIAHRAGRLYEKVAGFVDDMERVGRGIGMAQTSYDEAMGKLTTGRGNVLSQLETLKVLGAKTQKSFKTDFDGEAEFPAPEPLMRIPNDAAE